jgi:hypothetical protein
MVVQQDICEHRFRDNFDLMSLRLLKENIDLGRDMFSAVKGSL